LLKNTCGEQAVEKCPDARHIDGARHKVHGARPKDKKKDTP
jgi:hypothetical protein